MYIAMEMKMRKLLLKKLYTKTVQYSPLVASGNCMMTIVAHCLLRM